MRNITLSVAGVTLQIEDDSQVVPVYTYHIGGGVRSETAEQLASKVANQVRRAANRDLSGIVVDESGGLMWSAEDVVPKKCTQAEAEASCKALRLGGFQDWRMPTRKELLTLVDDTRHSPAIDVEKFPTCKSDWYWTSTAYAAYSGLAWVVGFGYGFAGSLHRGGYSAFVRAVRSAAPGQ